MKHFFTFLFFIFFCISSIAQTVKVIEIGTGFPIENVTIYNDSKDKVVYTDKKGMADVSMFDANDIISFNHLSYVEFEILKRDLTSIQYKISLNKKAEQLDEVVLSVTRNEEKRSRVAENLAITSYQEIKNEAPQTSADLLANLPGIKVQKSQFGGGSPVLRGMEANRVLLVVDGVRMNNAIYRVGHLQNSITVSPNILERTEVVFGPSSVIYGSDALGGVVHYFTRTPKISENDEVIPSVYSRYSSVNEAFTNEANIEISKKNWASFTSISHSKFGDLKMGKNRNHGFDDWGKVFEFSNNSDTYYNSHSVINPTPEIQKHTGYHQTDVLQKVVVPLSTKTAYIFNFQYSISSKIDRFDSLNERKGDDLKFAEWYYGPQNRLLLSSQLKINPEKKWLYNGIITAAFQKIRESRIQRKMNSLDRSYRKENVDVFSLNGDFFVPMAKENNRMLSYGFELTHNNVNSNAYGKTLEVKNNRVVGFSDDFIVQSRYPDGGGKYSSAASYVNYRQDITAKSTLNTGVRFVYTNLKAKWIDDTFITLPDFDITVDNSALTATVGYTYRPSDDWQLNGVISSGFRSPNLDDVGKIREKSGNVTVPNINLKPEYAYNFETSILKYFNNKKLRTGLNVYYTLLNNYITRDYFTVNNSSTILYDGDEGNVVANVNKDNAYIAGGTFSFKGNISNNWFTKGSVTYTKGKAYDTKEPLSSIPPLFGGLEVGFEKERLQAAVNWKFNGRKPEKDYNLIEGIDNIEQTPFITEKDHYYGMPSWSTFNMNANYKLKNNITIFMNIDNIFDVHYKEFATSISAPGRNFSVAVLIN